MIDDGTRACMERAGFRLERVLGRGGMGVVYLARDATTGNAVALKLIAPSFAFDPAFRERFLREARLAASLDDPGVVPIERVGEQDGVLFLAMRFVAGDDLASLLVHGPLAGERAVSLLEQVAGALDCAHAHGLVHRDVKPANVLVEGDRAYLADFGISRRIEDASGVTATGQVLGTLAYVAPELIEGGASTPSSDVYSLGCLLYESVTGALPFAGEHEAAVLYAHLRTPPPSARALNPALPRSLDTVIARALAKRPADRFASAGELARAAREALGEPRRPPRRRMLLAAAALATALAIAGGVALWGRDGPRRPSTPPAVAPPLPSAPPADWVANGPVRALATTPTTIYLGGTFSQLTRATGSGVVLPQSGPVRAAYPAEIRGGDVRVAIADGQGGWFVGGSFTAVAGVPVKGLCHLRVDGTLVRGFAAAPGGAVLALALHGDRLYAGGTFGLQVLDRATGRGRGGASTVPVEGVVRALAVRGAMLVVGGSFNRVGGTLRRNLTAFRLPGLTPVTTIAEADAAVDVLAVSGTTVYVGGRFTSLGGKARSGLAAIDRRGRLQSFDPQPNERVRALAMAGGSLLVVGDFTTIGGESRNRVAEFEPGSSHPTSFDPNVNAPVFAVSISGDRVVLGGRFTRVAGKRRVNLATVSQASGKAETWLPDPDGPVFALATTPALTFAGGGFSGIERRLRRNLAAIDRASRRPLDWRPQTSGDVNAIAVRGPVLYVGGSFDRAGGAAAGSLAALDLRHDDGRALPFGSGVDGSVESLLVDGSSLVVGGRFHLIAGSSRAGLAEVNASGAALPFSPVLSGEVDALALAGGRVVAGGTFTTSGGANLAAYDAKGAGGAIRGGADGPVAALAFGGGRLAVGGAFRTLAGHRSRNLGVLTLAGLPIGGPITVSGPVHALAFDRGLLALAGAFSKVGGQQRRGIAELRITASLAGLYGLRAPVTGAVLALAATPSGLIVAGNFSAIGTLARDNLVQLERPS